MQPASLWRSHRSVRLYLLFVLLAAALFSQEAFAATKVITDSDKGGTIHMKTGDTLEVRLEANPTTGFMWFLKKESTRLLKLTGQTETKPPEPAAGQPVMVGRPIFQVFEFQAKQPGDGILLLHYVRSWDPPSPNEQQFQIHVVVE
ncbi:MAG: protease inhibitor I42 family protein [Terracidiphilus sp.]|jgi:inhibitor of cysteine peptidase